MFTAGNESETDALPGTYEIYKAEADALFKLGEYRKAVDCYTMALARRQGDRICLVSRSKCYIKLGDTNKALQDAEASLEDDKDYHRGMFQKAEALFNQGDFEMALVYYHRGNRLRPELQEFRLGIQKAKEAIINCVGTPERVKLDTSGDLSFFQAQNEKKSKRKNVTQTVTAVPRRKRASERSAQNERTIRQLLGDLYGDKQYLEKLLKNTENRTETGRIINHIAEEGLNYLDTRTEFWQQIKPMYARKYETHVAMTRGKHASKTSPHEYILGELERIDAMMSESSFDAALKKAQKVLINLDTYKESQLANKIAFKASLYGFIGNAYLEMKNFPDAIKYHKKDLSIGEELGIFDAESRGLDNLGRVYARMGKFTQAIEIWERKLPMSKTSMEIAWLCHELGRCYLELNQARTAKDYGERSLAAAEEADDDMWQLHALVLISQSEVMSGRLSSSLISFEKALELADLLMDEHSKTAIRKAIDEVNAKISLREKEVQEVQEKKETESKGILGWFG